MQDLSLKVDIFAQLIMEGFKLSLLRKVVQGLETSEGVC